MFDTDIPIFSEDWFLKAKETVEPLLSSLVNPSSVASLFAQRAVRKKLPNEILQHPSVRMQLVKTAMEITRRCFESMSSIVPHVIDLIALHLFDEFDNISGASREAMAELSDLIRAIGLPCRSCFTFLSISRLLGDKGVAASTLIEVFENNANRLLSSMSRVFHFGDEAMKISSLNILNGYLSLMSSSVDGGGSKKFGAVSVMGILPKLIQVLFEILEFESLDTKDSEISRNRKIELIEDSPDAASSKVDSSEDGDDPVAAHGSYPRKYFRFFHSMVIEGQLRISFQLLANLDEKELVFDHMFHLLQSEDGDELKMAAVFALNELVANFASAKNKTDLKHLAKRLA